MTLLENDDYSSPEVIGRITGESTPSYFVMSINPLNPPPLYEYVFIELDEIPPGEREPAKVKVIAQIRAIKRKDIGLNPNLPWSVVEGVTDTQTQDQVIAIARILGYKWKDKIYTLRHAPPANTWVYKAPDKLLQEFYSVPVEQGLHLGFLITRPTVPIYLNMKGVNRHIAIIAATGSGKTWTSIVLIEELLKKGATILVLDPHGEYVKIKETIHLLGEEYRDSAIVLKGHRDQEGDILYRISIRNLSLEELAAIAGIPANAHRQKAVLYGAKTLADVLYEAFNDPKLITPKALEDFIETAIMSLETLPTRGKSLNNFKANFSKLLKEKMNIDLSNLEKDVGYKNRIDLSLRRLWLGLKRDIDTGYDVIRYIENLMRIGVYGSETIPLREILRPGHVTIFNLSGLRKEVQDHLVNNILTRVFNARVRHKRGFRGEKYPYPIVIILEEAHRFAPPKSYEDTWSREIISKIAAEGRKFGVFLVAITQRPSKIDSDLLSQCQSQIISRIVNPRDQDAVRDASEQLSQDLLDNLPALNPGEVVVVGPLAPAPVMIRVRDRVLDYAGADINVVEEWSNAIRSKINKIRLLADLRRTVGKVFEVNIDSNEKLLEGLANILSPNITLHENILESALNILLEDKITDLRYDGELGTIAGQVDGCDVEIRLSEGSWRCECERRVNHPCKHVIALLLGAIHQRKVEPEELRKAISLRPLNTLL